MLNNLLAITWQSRTYLRVLYLFLAFPLGVLYFTLLAALFSIGLGTALIAGIGIAALLLAAACSYGFANLERLLALHLLGVKVGPMALPGPPATSGPGGTTSPNEVSGTEQYPDHN